MALHLIQGASHLPHVETFLLVIITTRVEVENDLYPHPPEETGILRQLLLYRIIKEEEGAHLFIYVEDLHHQEEEGKRDLGDVPQDHSLNLHQDDFSEEDLLWVPIIVLEG